MEVIGGLIVSILVMVLLAGLGLATVVALGVMGVMGLLTEISFKRLFFVSFGIGLLVPLLLGTIVYGVFQDGSLERELRDDLSDVIQLPDDMGDKWSEALPKLQELSRDQDSGAISDEEAERRVREIFSDFEDLQITIDVNGDGEAGSGIPLELPAPVETGEVEGDRAR